jgi:peptidoglycan/xylan/chitin deacetylase (PgdA/CDA1 family)
VRHELTAARDLLQKRLGEHSPHFSYPYGREAAMSEVTDRLVAEMGYHCGLTLEQNIVRCATVDVLRLPRLIVSAQVGRVLFTLWQRFAG